MKTNPDGAMTNEEQWEMIAGGQGPGLDGEYYGIKDKRYRELLREILGADASEWSPEVVKQ